MVNMKLFHSPRALLLLYLSVLTWLSLGIIVEGNLAELFYLAGYGLICAAAFTGFYYFFSRIQINRFFSNTCNLNYFLLFSTVFILTVVMVQITVLGEVPVISAALTNNYRKITMIRQQITVDSPSFVNYLTSICIRAFLPFVLMLALYAKRTYLFWFFVIISTFFCCSLIQKSYIALVFLPAILLASIRKEWLKAFCMLGISVGTIFLLVYVTNPQIRPSGWLNYNREVIVYRPSVKSHTKNLSAVNAILNRVFLVPGEVVNDWFTYIPSKIPYGKGCGDRVLAKILHCEHINYSKRLYAEIFPEQFQAHISGTVNAASFMEWYANFGFYGLLIAGLEMGFWLAFVAVLLSNIGGPILLVVNALFILLLSSVSFHTLLLSGGWALTVLLVYLLRNVFIEEKLVGAV